MLFKGKEVSSDITGTHIKFWNAGKKPIKAEEVLDPLLISTADDTPILEAKTASKTREVIQIDLDKTALHEGRLEVTWNILEKNDGGVIQVIYAGSPQVGIDAKATIEGQPEIRRARYGSIEHIKKTGMIMSALGVLYFLMSAGLIRKARKSSSAPTEEKNYKHTSWFILALGFIFLVIGIGLLFFYNPPTPPI